MLKKRVGTAGQILAISGGAVSLERVNEEQVGYPYIRALYSFLHSRVSPQHHARHFGTSDCSVT